MLLSDRGLSYDEIIVIIVIIDISVIFPFSCIVTNLSRLFVFKWNSLGFNLLKAHEVLA